MKKIIVALMFGVALLWANELAQAEEQAKNMEKCEANDAQACFEVKHFEKACDLGLAKACIRYVQNSYDNWGKSALPEEEIIALYKKACDLGDMEGCKRMLDKMSWSEETYELYKKYCLNDAIESICYAGAHRFGYRPTDKFTIKGKVFSGVEIVERVDFKADELTQKYVDILSQKCDDGEIKTCVFLGESYLDGYTTDDSSGGRDLAVGKTQQKQENFYKKPAMLAIQKLAKNMNSPKIQANLKLSYKKLATQAAKTLALDLASFTLKRVKM